MALKILFPSWNFPPAVGGIEHLIGHVFHGLVARGHEVVLLTARREGAPAVPGVHAAPRPGLAAFVLFTFTAGFRWMRRLRPDVILCGSLVSAPAGWLLSRLFRRPYAVLAYGGELVHGGWLYRAVARFVLRRADLLLPISRHTRDLLEGAGVPMARSVIVHPGVDAAAFDTPPAGGTPPTGCEGRKVLLIVGRLIRRKGVLEFVENVMPGLARRYPDALLLVAGEDAKASLLHKAGGMRAAIESAIAARGLGDRVRLLGQVSDADLWHLYRRADLFLLPCLDIPGDVEGFGIVFSEAALAGTPSLATRVGGIPDAVADGVSGLLTPPGDWAALEEAAARLLGDDALRASLGRAAAARARAEFDWPVICAKYEDALLRLTSRA